MFSKRENRGTALITGASGGIGKELACLFAQHGHRLVLVARDGQRLAELADSLRTQHGTETTVLARDLAAPSAAEELYSTLAGTGVQIDILVNNAGFALYGPFAETDLQVEVEMLQLNVVTLTRLSKLFLPGMIERRSGRIMNVASTASFAPLPFAGVYGATKAYVLSFSEALAEELRGTGVTVTALCPGATATGFAQRAGMTATKLFRSGTLSAKSVAEAGYRALMRGQTTVVTGPSYKLLVQSIRFSPRCMVTRVGRKMMS
jgi:short-subunit dehydrogenase